MTERPPAAAGPELAGAAWEGAAEAEASARAAGVSIELIGGEAGARELTAALGRVWRQPAGSEPLPSELAWALAHAGNYVAVARDRTGAVVGGAVGFRGADQAGPYLHSHIAGVVDSHQGSGVGLALKRHQRAWALAAGMDRMTWTFDPLVARNAYFNVTKLRADITRYYVDFYGPMHDAINSGDESDRCLVTWRLNAGDRRETPRPADAAEVLSVGPGDRPVLRPAGKDRLWLASLPADAVALRRRDPALALQWRLALRQVLGEALGDSRPVVGFTRASGYLIGPAT